MSNCFHKSHPSDDTESEENSTTSTSSQEDEVEAQVAEEDDDDDDDDEELEADVDDEDEEDRDKTNEKKAKPSSTKKTTEKKKTTPTKRSSSTGSSSKKAATPAAVTPKKSTSSTSTPAKKSHIQLVHDAIVAMKDRTGSSQVAIQKYIMANHKDVDMDRFKQRLLLTLKQGIKSKRLIKFKASYKIHPDFLKKQRRAAAATKKPKAPQPKPQKKLSAAELRALKEKEERERKEKERQERIRKRKFPMEDLAMIAEDKELGVHVPLPTRPALPLAMPDFPAACKSDTTMSGLWEDILHVYHFFRGDVGWGLLQKQPTVAPFSLSHWIHAIQQVLNGNAKKSRMVPPLVSHLFCVALQHLLKDQLPKLAVGLSPSSWSEILLLYMDAMERYASSESSVDDNVVAGLPIDCDYLLGVTDEPKDDMEPESTGPFYLSGLLGKAHAKLLVQDPWLLSAEELLCLLRALVDDLLASTPALEIEMDHRLVEVMELQKKKRTADALVRKLQTTMNKEAAEEKEKTKEVEEQHKKATRSNTKSLTAITSQLETAKRQQQRITDAYEKACRTMRIRTEPIGEDRHFHAFYNFGNDPQCIYVQQRMGMTKPSATWNVPAEFRTHKTSWHMIDKKSLLDKYLASLDTRGKRESNLHQQLHPLRRFLFDDIKELQDKKALLREKEELQRRLENAKLKCEVGRKSGRLAGKAEEEFIVLQADIDLLQNSIKGEVEPTPIDYEDATGLRVLREFDGTSASHGAPRKRTTRRDTKKHEESERDDHGHGLVKLTCSKLWPSGHIDGTGIVGCIVADLLELEERAESLAKWVKKDRTAWISHLETLVHSWHATSPPVLNLNKETSTSSSTPESPTVDDGNKASTNGSTAGSDSKRKKGDGGTPGAAATPSASLTIAQILSSLKVRPFTRRF